MHNAPGKITGVQISYYFICPTKLWLFSRNITLERDYENVKIGRFLHEDRYKRKKKDETIWGTISIDFVNTKDGLVLHEIKKTKKMEDAHRYQMLYYLHFLKNNGIDAKGIINYPLINKKEDVILTDSNEKEVERICQEIQHIKSSDIRTPERKNICKKCAYQEFCFGDEI